MTRIHKLNNRQNIYKHSQANISSRSVFIGDFIKSQAGKWQAEADAENAKQSARLAGRMKAQTLLLSQIRDNEDARARERQQEYFQMRLMKQQEATFEHQLNAMKGETYVPNDFRKKSAGWFS